MSEPAKQAFCVHVLNIRSTLLSYENTFQRIPETRLHLAKRKLDRDNSILRLYKALAQANCEYDLMMVVETVCNILSVYDHESFKLIETVKQQVLAEYDFAEGYATLLDALEGSS